VKIFLASYPPPFSPGDPANLVVRTIPRKKVHINMCPIFNGCGDTAVWSWRLQIPLTSA
jgi:hypothetical protein